MTVDTLNELDADHQIDPGEARPVIFTCLNAHHVRREDLEAAKPAASSARRCRVCGAAMRKGYSKDCSPRCRRFVVDMRNQAYLAHLRRHGVHRKGGRWVPFTFIVETQPWYRGAAVAYRAAEPVARLIPAAWWDGWQRVHDAGS